MSFVDPFEEIDMKIELAKFKPKVNAFVDAYRKRDKETAAQMLREDPNLKPIFDFIQYYEAATMTPQNTDIMRDIESKSPKLAAAYWTGKLKSMTTPWTYYDELKAKGMGSRADIFELAALEAKYPQLTRKGGRSRRRTGRARRGRGRRSKTSRR